MGFEELLQSTEVLCYPRCRQLEEVQLQLTKANERAAELQGSVDQAARKAEEEQQDAHKKHQAELQKLQGKLGDLVSQRKGCLVASEGISPAGQQQASFLLDNGMCNTENRQVARAGQIIPPPDSMFTCNQQL